MGKILQGRYYYDLIQEQTHRAGDRNWIHPWLDERVEAEDGGDYIWRCRLDMTLGGSIKLPVSRMAIP
jgi:hypothetical protein